MGMDIFIGCGYGSQTGIDVATFSGHVGAIGDLRFILKLSRYIIRWSGHVLYLEIKYPRQ
jgi:hypothetical protein